MPFYAFRLNAIKVNNQRGKIPDDDVVTFQVAVNTVLRGQGTILLEDVASGALLPLVPPPSPTYTFTPLAPNPGSAQNIDVDWIIGPFELAPGDGVTILYTGTNVSDQYVELNKADQDKLTLQLADAFAEAFFGEVVAGEAGAALGAVSSKASELLGKVSDVVGKVSDVLGDVLSDILGDIKDPVGKLVNYQPQGPCNGAAFGGQTQLTGAELAKLPYAPHSEYASLPNAVEFPTTVNLTDAVNHDTNICGHVADTDVMISVLQIPEVSARYYLNRVCKNQSLAGGIRKFAPAGQPISLRSFLHLTP